MVICKAKHRKNTKNIQIIASGHKVKQVNKVKILGYTMLNNLHHDKHITKVTSNINHRLFNIKKLTPHTTIKSRNILTKAIVIGKLNYCLPLLCNAKKAQLTNLNTLITKSCRTIMPKMDQRKTIKQVPDAHYISKHQQPSTKLHPQTTIY